MSKCCQCRVPTKRGGDEIYGISCEKGHLFRSNRRQACDSPDVNLFLIMEP